MELLLIVAFWTFMAVLTAANALLDPRGPVLGMLLVLGLLLGGGAALGQLLLEHPRLLETFRAHRVVRFAPPQAPREIFKRFQRLIASEDFPMLGQSGKGVLARWIHENSARRGIHPEFLEDLKARGIAELDAGRTGGGIGAGWRRRLRGVRRLP